MNNTRQERFFCSECGQEIPTEFIGRLRQGEPVFCEACGTKITIQIQKTVGLPRVEKARSSTSRSPPQPPLRRPEPPVAKPPIAPEPGMAEVLDAQRKTEAIPARNIETQKKTLSVNQAISKVDKAKLEEGIQGLNKLSLAIGVLIVTITGPIQLVRTAGTLVFFWNLAAIICALGAVIIDARFYKVIIQKDYSFRGIDLIIWGFIGCFGYGVGALVLVKGLVILAYTMHPNSAYPILTRVQWFHVIISRLNANSFVVTLLIWSGTIPTIIANLVNNALGGEYVAFAVMGLVVLLVDKAFFAPKLKGNLENRRKVEIGLGLLVTGIIGTFDFAMGTILLLKGLAVLMLSAIPEEVRQKEPLATPSTVPGNLSPVDTNVVPRETTVTKIEREAVPVPEPRVPEPAPVNAAPQPTSIQSASKKPQEIPPETTTTTTNTTPSGRLTGKPVSGEVAPATTEDFEKQAAIQTYLNRVYTVLSSKIRDRVQKLAIPEAEKREILDGLLNLTQKEQEQFLAELEELARRLMPEIVGRILHLNLSKEQNDVLIRQLEYLSDQEQLEFVAELERARFGAV